MGRRRSGVAIVTTTRNNHGDSDFSVTWHYFCHLETDCFFFSSIMYFRFFFFRTYNGPSRVFFSFGVSLYVALFL